MPGDSEVPKNIKRNSADAMEGAAMKQAAGGLGVEDADVEPREVRSKLSAARKAKSFIKPSSKGPKTEDMQPIPWPMPPRLHEKKSEEESSANVSQKRDGDTGDREYLTPQSSFAPHGTDNSLQVDSVPALEPCPEGSCTYSRESSVKRESFSSVGTGFSLALQDSSDSASSESVTQVDIDADEFAHFLSEKTKTSQSMVDFAQLFADNDQEGRGVENEDSSLAKKTGSSEFFENSTTPKALRAPFRHRKSTKPNGNTVSLTEALEFSPDYKVLGAEHGPPFQEEPNRLGKGEGRGVKKDETEPEVTKIEPDAESGLRRPMASRQKTFLVLPRRKETPFRLSVSEGTSDIATSSSAEQNNVSATDGRQSCSAVQTTPPVKGVIMRAQAQASQVAGIRRAETGRIMSRAELRAQKPIMFQESPNPKSLNPAGFPNEEEDVTTVPASSLFPGSSSDSDNFEKGQTSSRKLSSTNEAASTKQRHSNNSSPSARKADDGSFLSPGILSRKKKFGTEEYRVDSFQFSEHDGSSGFLNRFSSGFRRMHLAVAKKAGSHEVSQDAAGSAGSAIVVSGTIDEAVCRICVVCRKQLECDVYVKDTGKKIKVESRKDGKSRYLRATILVRQIPGESSVCEVYIRQSRSDGMKTSLATLWNFYQRLEAGLKEMG